MTTSRNVYDDVRNVVDFLEGADLLYFSNAVSLSPRRVAWHAHDKSMAFLTGWDHPTVEQYLAWLTAGAYTVILFDGSLLQVRYDIDDREITGHRLAYIPCPFDLDLALLAEGEPLADVVELYRSGDGAMRSPVRFDFDPQNANAGHPAVHLTMNTTGCRIQCAAPIHILRFVDFVFRNFYPDLWQVHRGFFGEAPHQHVEWRTPDELDQTAMHIAWDVRARATTASALR